MNTFPSTPKPRMGSGEEKNYYIISSEFEGNYKQTRKGATRAIKKFTLNYSNISDEEFYIFEDFFDANIGGEFIFLNPRTNNSHRVRFAENRLNRTYTTANRCNLQIILEEI